MSVEITSIAAVHREWTLGDALVHLLIHMERLCNALPAGIFTSWWCSGRSWLVSPLSTAPSDQRLSFPASCSPRRPGAEWGTHLYLRGSDWMMISAHRQVLCDEVYIFTDWCFSSFAQQREQELFPLGHSCAVCGKVKCKRHRYVHLTSDPTCSD